MTKDLAGLGRLSQRRPVLRESVALAALCTADMLSTLYVVRSHLAVESNPIFVGPLAHSDFAFLAAKAVTYLVPIAVLELLRPVRPELVPNALRACVVGYVALYVLGSIGVRLAA